MKKIVCVTAMVCVETPDGVEIDEPTLHLAASVAARNGKAQAENIIGTVLDRTCRTVDR